ncbi:hypothetical protein KXD40_007111 [Peronospora effusa]|nr:hypothetical protein KXD40_007111 [Peronospora effusa]
MLKDRDYRGGIISMLKLAGSARNALGRGLYTGKLVSADKAYRMGKQLRALHRLEDEMRVQQTPEYLRLVFQKLMVKMLGLQISTVEKLMRNIQNELRSEPIPQAKLCKLFSLCDLNYVDQLVDVHDAIQTEMKISSMSISDWSFELVRILRSSRSLCSDMSTFIQHDSKIYWNILSTTPSCYMSIAKQSSSKII